MRKLFFMLAFMLIGFVAFAAANIENNMINSDVFYENETMEESAVVDFEFHLSTEAVAATYYCAVEDGHFRGEAFGNTPAQACRKARRALKKDMKEFKKLANDF